MGNSQGSTIEWKSKKYIKIKGVIKIPTKTNEPAYLTYDKSSTFKPGKTIEISMEPPEEKTDDPKSICKYIFIIKEGWYIDLKAGPQKITYHVVEKTNCFIKGTYVSLVPIDTGTFWIAIE